MPWYPPVGWPKSKERKRHVSTCAGRSVSHVQVVRSTGKKKTLTFLPGRDDLHGVDNLRVESRGHLNADDAREQENIERSQIRLPPPRGRVIHRQAMNDIVRDWRAATHFAQLGEINTL